MYNLSEIELILILGFYYLDDVKNVENFTKNFNRYFKRDVSAQTILFLTTKFRNIDPSNNMKIENADVEYISIWNEYLGKERVSELRDIYRSFKKGMFVNKNHEFDPFEDWFGVAEITIKEMDNLDFVDRLKDKSPIYETKGVDKYKRSRIVVENALAYAKYLCEAQCTTTLFLRKDCGVTYTEAHHLIPLCYQDEFKYSLDIESNIISLCPNCHRRLHYGYDIKEILMKFYSERNNRLKSCGIDITFEKLLLLYR